MTQTQEILQNVEYMATELMAEHGILQIGWKFKFDSAKRRYGLCSYRKKTIFLSRYLTPLRDIGHTKNTILHEIAHALVGCNQGHNHVWRSKAVSIGCTGERCSNDVKLQPKFKGECPCCHRIIFKHKRNKVSCGKCDKKFNPDLMFIWSLA